MKYNKHNLKAGDIVILDEGFRNSSTVKVLHITVSSMYSHIVPAELKEPYKESDCWDVMTSRLTPIKTNNHDNQND